MKQIRFFVEGKDDQVFIEYVVKPLCRLYDVAFSGTVQCSQTDPKKIASFVHNTIRDGSICFFLADQDSLQYHTLEQRLRSIYQKYQLPSSTHLVVVIEEIESWYIAGLSHYWYKELQLGSYHQTTNTLTKEMFNHLFQTTRLARGGRASLLPYLLHRFDPDIACERNSSFQYFYKKLNDVLVSLRNNADGLSQQG